MLGITPFVSKSESRLIGMKYSSLLRLRAICSLAVSMSRIVSPSFSRKIRKLCPPISTPSRRKDDNSGQPRPGTRQFRFFRALLKQTGHQGLSIERDGPSLCSDLITPYATRFQGLAAK